MITMRSAGPLAMVGALCTSGCDTLPFPPHGGGWGGGHGGHGGHGQDCGTGCPDTAYERDGACARKTKSISAGVGYTCAILEENKLKCWGGDSWYRLGYGPPQTNRGDDPGEMGDVLPEIPLVAGLVPAQIYADSDLTCALLTNGGVKCWGYNGYGAVTGVPNPPSVSDTVDLLPVRTFSGGRSAVQVLAGSGTGYALLNDGTIVQITTSVSPYDLGAGRFAVSFDRSTRYDDWHLCAVLDDGSVACKGGGAVGQLGRDPSLDAFPMPAGGYPLVELGTGRTASAVALGDDHTCALLDGGDVKCWGGNGYGQLGQGDTTNRGLSPTDMGDALAPVPLGAPALAVTSGRNHVCALLDDGRVKCWGRNDAGQLGIGSTANVGDDPGEVASLASVDLGPGRTAVAIDAGTHTCALLDNGAVKCWGANDQGQLGQGDTTSRGGAPGQLGDALTSIDLGT